MKNKKLTAQERQLACVKEIQNSLKKYNCVISARPVWKPRDDGTFSLVVVINVIARNG